MDLSEEKTSADSLSEGQASADPLTRFISNLVGLYAADIQFDTFSTFSLGPTAGPEGFDCSSDPVSVTDCVGS